MLIFDVVILIQVIFNILLFAYAFNNEHGVTQSSIWFDSGELIETYRSGLNGKCKPGPDKRLRLRRTRQVWISVS